MKRRMIEKLILLTLTVSGTDVTVPLPHLPEVSSQVEVTMPTLTPTAIPGGLRVRERACVCVGGGYSDISIYT